MNWKYFGVAAVLVASAGVAGGVVLMTTAVRTPEPRDLQPAQQLRDDAPTREGLHYTQEEVEIWRRRSLTGPFRTESGPPEHYPGDWERIRRNADAFLSDPEQVRWLGPADNNPGSCVEVDPAYPSSNPPGDPTIRLRDAAFYYLVRGHTGHREAVKRELLSLADQPGLDFSNRDRWCTGVLWDLPPSWDIAIWLSQLLYAYDYLGPQSFTASERQRLNEWFYHAADYWQRDGNEAISSRFVDRWNGDYTLTHADCDSTRVAYYGSKPVCTLAMFHNNRRAHVFRFVTSTAIKLEMEDFTLPADASPGMSLADLRRSGTLFAQEWLTFSTYPEGFFGEFERWRQDNPILGWTYSAGVISPVVSIADELARAGDRSVVDFSTRDGALGTSSGGGWDWGEGTAVPGSGPEKNLEFAIEMYGRYVDGTFVRYGTDNSNNINEDYRIRSYNVAADYHTNVDAGLMMANNYYRNDYVKRMYLRAGAEMPNYPSEPADGGLHGWMGNGRIYPGVLFMFGKLEGQVWPYD